MRRILNIKILGRRKFLLAGVILLLCTLPISAKEEKENDVNTVAFQDSNRWKTLKQEAKVEVVKKLIKALQEENVIIRKNPAFYSHQIDVNQVMYSFLFRKPLGIQLNTMAILYGDYDNGENPFTLIRETFGHDFYIDYIQNGLQEKYSEQYDQWLEENVLKKKGK